MISPDSIVQELGKDFLAWWEGFGKIQDVRGKIISPTSNYLQKKIYDVWLYCQAMDLPCRIIVLKPRQKGSSTISTGMLYHTCSVRTTNAAVIGGEYKQGAVLWRKLQAYELHDAFPWPSGKGHIDEEKGKWPNGSYLGLATARNKFAGVASTNQFLLITELAKWASEGVANASQVLSEILKTVHDVEGTTVIIESTAFGAYGPYYDHWQSAVTFEEFKAGKMGYVKIFAAWYEFDDSRISPAWPKDRIEEVIGNLRLDPQEIEDYVKDWNLDEEQLSWMLFTIQDKCERDFDIFKQDYPSDEETAFLKSGRQRFNASGVKRLKQMARSRQPDYGVIEETGERISWRTTDRSEATFWRWEEPRVGMSYLVMADPAAGDNQTGGKDPDRHSVLVLRKGYHDEEGRWHRPAVVARIRPPCRWDIDVLEKQLWRLARYYGGPGGCAILIEVNKEGGLIELLKQRGAQLLTRKMFNHREGKETTAIGWLTNEATRDIAIQAEARAIRDWDENGYGIDLWCPHIVEEMENFIEAAGGRAEAAQGKHDDDVLSLGIGLYNIDRASLLVAPKRRRPVLHGDHFGSNKKEHHTGDGL